ncbi:MAG: hypothetical protein DELT_01087 [Desulfovibrio sp.]
MPKLTVIMSVFNGAQTVDATIESIRNQRFSDFTFIIVDDASTDATAEILARHARDDARIRVITNPVNQERCASRNTAIQASDSEYVAVMDADDIALPHRFSRQIAFLDAHPEVAICGAFVELFGEVCGVRSYPVMHDDIAAGLLFYNSMAHPALVCRRKCFDTAQYDVEFPLAEDYELLSRMVFGHGARCYNLPEVLLRYRTRPPENSFLPWHSEVLRRNIQRLGLEPTERELAIHAALSLGLTSPVVPTTGTEPLPDSEETYTFGAVLSWLEKLAQAQTETRLVAPDALVPLLRAHAFRAFRLMGSYGDIPKLLKSPMAKYEPARYRYALMKSVVRKTLKHILG